MSRADRIYRFAAVSAVKNTYVALAVAAHPRFAPVVLTDEADVPQWAHERNQLFADELGVPYVRGVEQAFAEYDLQLAAVSSEAERRCDQSVRAIEAGLHVIQDKPMSTKLSECDRVVDAVARAGVKFMKWSRNYLPAVSQAREALARGAVGKLPAITSTSTSPRTLDHSRAVAHPASHRSIG